MWVSAAHRGGMSRQGAVHPAQHSPGLSLCFKPPGLFTDNVRLIHLILVSIICFPPWPVPLRLTLAYQHIPLTCMSCMSCTLV